MASSKPKTTPLAEYVDELGALEKELAPWKPKQARVEALRKAIRAHFDKSPPAEAFEARGDRFIVTVGPCAVERTFNPAKLIKAIGLKLYAQIARPSLKAIEESVAPEIAAGVITQGHTGPRPLKTFERPAA